MANDRLWLACKVCRERSPMLGKYWVDRFDWWADTDTLGAWIQEHWLHCAMSVAGDSPFVILDENGDTAMPKPDPEEP